jgi:hypothetical protein
VALLFFLFRLFHPIFYLGLLGVTFRLSFRTSKRQKNPASILNQEDLPANRLNKDTIFCYPTNMWPYVRASQPKKSG